MYIYKYKYVYIYLYLDEYKIPGKCKMDFFLLNKVMGRQGCG